MNDYADMLGEDEFVMYEDELSELSNQCDTIVEWWTEDYPLDELFEELDVTGGDALYAMVLVGMIDREDLIAYLSSDA